MVRKQFNLGLQDTQTTHSQKTKTKKRLALPDTKIMKTGLILKLLGFMPNTCFGTNQLFKIASKTSKRSSKQLLSLTSTKWKIEIK